MVGKYLFELGLCLRHGCGSVWGDKGRASAQVELMEDDVEKGLNCKVSSRVGVSRLLGQGCLRQA
jgi:hypothetical protein